MIVWWRRLYFWLTHAGQWATPEWNLDPEPNMGPPWPRGYTTMMIKNDADCKIRCEGLMSEIVDLLAAFPETRLDPRAWQQLLIYNKPPSKQEKTP